jgi:hypothetical protein
MPEGSEDATIMIAISWQALKRAESNCDPIPISDCTVAIVFSAFFIEANLNLLIKKMNKTSQMERFLGNPNAGLQDKLAWYYNFFVAKSMLVDREKMYKNDIVRKLRRKFPGFGEIYDFRNNVSHGKINPKTANLNNAIRLRNQSKAIVDCLFEIATKAGYNISRDITYIEAIEKNIDKSDHPSFYKAA